MALRIELPHVELLATTPALARLDVEDRAAFARALNATVPEGWPAIVVSDVRPFMAQVLAEHPDEVGWWGWYIILRAPERTLIGNVGLKGPPSADGLVECGYVILEPFRRRGFATEALGGLCDWAFANPRVHRIIGRTYPGLIASIRTMEKNHFRLAGPPDSQGIIAYARECGPTHGQ
jgi:[ribosomal protein S5]-alanine N-acetyltransferase